MDASKRASNPRISVAHRRRSDERWRSVDNPSRKRSPTNRCLLLRSGLEDDRGETPAARLFSAARVRAGGAGRSVIQTALSAVELQLQASGVHALLGRADLGASVDSGARRIQILRDGLGIRSSLQCLADAIARGRCRERGCSKRSGNEQDAERDRSEFHPATVGCAPLLCQSNPAPAGGRFAAVDPPRMGREEPVFRRL